MIDTGTVRLVAALRISAWGFVALLSGCYAHHVREAMPPEVDAARPALDATVVLDASVPESGCGDGVLDDGEECDSEPGCLPDCRYSGCGPGTREGGSCDDGDPCTSGDRCALGICVGIPRASHPEVISEVPNYEILGQISSGRLLGWGHYPEGPRIVDVTSDGLVVRSSMPMDPQWLAPFGALDGGRRVAFGDRPLQLFDVSSDGSLHSVGTPIEIQAGVYQTVGYTSLGRYLYGGYYQLGSYLPALAIIDTTDPADVQMEVRTIGTAHQVPGVPLVSLDGAWLWTLVYGNTTSWPTDLVQWSLEDPANPVEVRRIRLGEVSEVRVVATGVLLLGSPLQFVDAETGSITDVEGRQRSLFVTPAGEGWATEEDTVRGNRLVRYDFSRLPTLSIAEEISLTDLQLDFPYVNWVGTLAEDPSARWVALSRTAFYRLDADGGLRGPLDASGLGAVSALVADRDGQAFAVDSQRTLSHIVDLSTVDAPFIVRSTHHGFAASVVRVRSGARTEILAGGRADDRLIVRDLSSVGAVDQTYELRDAITASGMGTPHRVWVESWMRADSAFYMTSVDTDELFAGSARIVPRSTGITQLRSVTVDPIDPTQALLLGAGADCPSGNGGLLLFNDFGDTVETSSAHCFLDEEAWAYQATPLGERFFMSSSYGMRTIMSVDRDAHTLGEWMPVESELVGTVLGVVGDLVVLADNRARLIRFVRVDETSGTPQLVEAWSVTMPAAFYPSLVGVSGESVWFSDHRRVVLTSPECSD